MLKEYLSIREAAEYSGLSKHYLYKLSAKRALPMLKVGSRNLIPTKCFQAYLEKFRVGNKGVK